jgi:hypothetical protein
MVRIKFPIISLFTQKAVLSLSGLLILFYFIVYIVSSCESCSSKVEGFNVYDILNGDSTLYPGYACKFGNTDKGCNNWEGCNDWKGSVIHPDTKKDMKDLVSLKCQNPNAVNNLHRNWNKEWLDDNVKLYGGARCASQTDGYNCKSGLCLMDSQTKSKKCADYKNY